jgi:Tol biopolymer transport system component/predicted Ser/Thr protein kinase
MTPSSFIGHYQVTAKLGEGGMGEVWRARDTRLNRDVAIKVLPQSFADDAARMQRFEREAQVLASLNHPNIAAIYGIEQNAIVMEVVEGEDLRGPVPVDTAIAYARQIAAGLEAAHEKGIVHRDLKPANIKVTPDGAVKLLDFGLAKAAEATASAAGSPTLSPTMSLGMTQAGVILGTAAYMSPEQARGKAVDKRADIWAFGVVLYELLTGRMLFGGGETVSDALAAVITTEPDWKALPADTPPHIRRLLERCLRKDPKLRLRDIGEARIALDEPARATALPAPSPARSRLPWAIAAFATLAAAALAFLYWRKPAEEPHAIRFQIPYPEKTAPPANLTSGGFGAISPDGRHFAYIANSDGKFNLWVRDLDSLSARQLPGTDEAGFPFWSPDSRSIGFFAGGRLRKIGLAGGPAQTICEANAARSGSWGGQGVIIFNNGFGTGVLRVSEAGGTPVPATTPDQAAGEGAHYFPSFLPDGHRFLYLASSSDREKSALWVADLNSKERSRVMTLAVNALYSPPGFLLFLSDRTLMAQPFDAGSARTRGDAIPVAEAVDSGTFLGLFSVSRNGILVYSSGGSAGQSQLTWFDRAGKALGTVGPAGSLNWPVLSPDDKTVAVSRMDPQTKIRDIWLHDLARGSSYRLTSHPRASSTFPMWSPDGAWVGYYSSADSSNKINRKAASGAGEEEVLIDPKPPMRADDWSPDGSYLMGETGRGAGGNLWVMPLSGSAKPYQFLHSEFREIQARISPDSRWVAYVSDRTGREEVYVTSFPTAGSQTQISTTGGRFPTWSRDGRELFYLAPDRSLMAVSVKSAASFEAGIAKRLFEVPFANYGANTSRFDVSRDGRFLMPVELDNGTRQAVSVVVNWTAGLK